jgi:NADPH:quinone reductase-like Zn-dependent oxidoreductase
MKAATFKKYGPSEWLEITEVETPTPEDDELLVKVHAATVTRTDCGFLRGKPFVTRFFSGLLTSNQTILGEEFAGEIEAVVKDVTEFQVGDRVFGYDEYGEARIGAQAEYTVIAADTAVTTIPDGLSYEQAAPSNEGCPLRVHVHPAIQSRTGDERADQRRDRRYRVGSSAAV